MIENEIWEAVAGFDGYYEVSNFGNVKGVDRMVKNGHGERLIKSNYLKLLPAFDGYLGVQLRKGCKKTCLLVHRIVATVFVFNDGNMPIVNHKDFNKQNNHYSNLEWTTKSGNAYHAISGGRWNSFKNRKIA